MLYIGESINATIKSVKKAILDQDEAFLIDLARPRLKQGRNYLMPMPAPVATKRLRIWSGLSSWSKKRGCSPLLG